MKKHNKIKKLGIFLVLTLVLLTGCASDTTETSFDYAFDNGGSYVGQQGASPETGRPVQPDYDATEDGYDNSKGGGGPSGETLKVVSMLRMTAESKKFGEDVENLENKIHLLMGYISSHEIRTFEESQNRKEASISIRVPRENAPELVEFMKKNLSIVSESSQTIDITDTFYDTESRIKNLESQADQLRSLYDRTDSIEEIIMINDKLNEVVREKESLTKSFMGMKERTSYSTIDILIKEVSELTITESIDDTLMDKIEKGLNNSWNGFKNEVVNIIVTLANSMSLIVLLIIGIIVYNKYFKGIFKVDPAKISPHETDTEKNDENNDDLS